MATTSNSAEGSSGPRNHLKRYARLTSPPSDLDLRSLPPTPQDQTPYPLGGPLESVDEDPFASSSLSVIPPVPLPKSPIHQNGQALPFPKHHRRKASVNSTNRASIASTASNYSIPDPTTPGPSTAGMPPVPVRSPLRRPHASSNASYTGILAEFDLAPNSPLPLSSSLAGSDPRNLAPKVNRPLPRRPSDPLSRLINEETGGLAMMNPNPSLTSFAPTLTPENVSASTSKRKHALLELLSTERAYAADLALVKDIHIPLSRGLPPAFEPPPSHPPTQLGAISRSSPHSSSPRSSTHTNSSAQTSSSASTAASSVNPADLPMTPEASKIIFQNIDELAIFADGFSNRLEMALGDILPEGHGEDCVGELFLEKIPIMSTLFKNYITRHPTALAQFQSLPPNPALTAYLSQTRTLVASHSNAWDVPSFLIKPVQRLLKYPLLLSAIYNDTPDSHGDKTKLIEAKERIEEVARMVNEGRRRWEVVKGILNKGTTNSASNGPPTTQPMPPRVNRMRSFRSKIKVGIMDTTDLDQGKIELEQWERRIKECEGIVKDLAKETLEWAGELETSFKRLKAWNAAFGRVLGLGDEGLEAVGAFGKVVTGMQQLSGEFMTLLRTSFLPQLSALLRTLASPRTLLTHMHTLRHSHVTLMNLPYNKSRPHSSLIEASNDYTALRATLRDELPVYIALFEKGVASCIMDLSGWQEVLWQEVTKRWIIFWTALASEGEGEVESIAALSAGAEETKKVWMERFEGVEAAMTQLQILIRPPKGYYRNRAQTSESIKSRSQTDESLFRQSNGSSISIGDGRGVYQQATRARSAYDLQDQVNRTEQSRSWGAIEQELERHSAGSTASLRGKHKRNGSAQESVDRTRQEMAFASIVPGGMMTGAVLLPATSKPKSKSKKEKKKSDGVPIPRLVEPFGQDMGVGGAFAPPIRPVPTSPDAKKKEKSKSRDDDETLAGRPTSPRPFRRITDTLFGIPRSGGHGRSKSRGSEKDVDISGRSSSSSQQNSRRQSEAEPRKSISSAILAVSSSSQEILVPGAGYPPLEPPPSPLYTCTTIVPFIPPLDAKYMNRPLLHLRVGDTVQVLYEAGHPSEHNLPIAYDDAPDCVLLARDEFNRVGWVLASYLLPLV